MKQEKRYSQESPDFGEELERIVNSMNKSKDGDGVGREHQQAKELGDVKDWAKEMNRIGGKIDEESIRSVDQEQAAFPDCIVRTSRGDCIGIEVTGPGSSWDTWTADIFEKTVEQTIKSKSKKAKKHRQNGTIIGRINRIVLLITIDIERCQMDEYIEKLGIQETSEFEEIYIMMSYQPDDGGGTRPVFQVRMGTV